MKTQDAAYVHTRRSQEAKQVGAAFVLQPLICSLFSVVMDAHLCALRWEGVAYFNSLTTCMSYMHIPTRTPFLQFTLIFCCMF